MNRARHDWHELPYPVKGPWAAHGTFEIGRDSGSLFICRKCHRGTNQPQQFKRDTCPETFLPDGGLAEVLE